MNLVPQELVQLALNGYLVICANNRQFLELKKDIEPHLESRPDFYPKIATLKSWAKYQFELNYPDFKIITDFQSTVLFEKIISSHPQGEDISNIPSAAVLATSALNTVSSYNIPEDELTSETFESELFSVWLKTFQEHCVKRKLVPEVKATPMVSDLFSNDDFHVSKRVCFYGFLKTTPIENILIDKLKDHAGTFSEINELSLSVSKPLNLKCNAISDEITQCVAFVKELQDRNEDITICITSPILSEIQDELSYAILRQFSSLTKQLDETCHSSLGEPLFDTPEIQSLLFINELYEKKTLTPFEYDYIKASDAISSEFLNKIESNECNDANEFIEDYTKINTFFAHSEKIQKLIEHIDWCGNSEPRHEQIKAKLTEVIELLSTCDITNQTISHSNYLFKLTEILQTTPFKLNNTKHHNIHILGIYETIGLNFDHVWVIGANADYWPNKIKANKLIAQSVSERYEVVLKDKKETQLFEDITNRLIASCYELYFSYSSYQGEKELLPPSFFKSSTELHVNKNEIFFLPNTKISSENVDDSFGTTIEDNSKCPKGTRYIESHNNCSFMSHYTCRFDSINKIDDASFAENKAHGDLTHNVLEIFWSQYKSTDNVKKLAPQELQNEILRVIDKTISEYEGHASLPSWFFENEKWRLKQMISDFISLEMKRNFVVEDVEKKVYLTVENLKFTLFIDRIEIETVFGKDKELKLRLVSDHKTGKETPSDWFKIPCPKPQLPIYSTIENVDGAVFNIIRDDDISYKGFVRDGLGKSFKITTPRIGNTTWEQQKNIWSESIKKSVSSLKSGFSVPSPLKPTTCTFCSLQRVCRINENT